MEEDLLEATQKIASLELEQKSKEKIRNNIVDAVSILTDQVPLWQ